MLDKVEPSFRLRRSILITPGDDEHLLSKAAEGEADVNSIDWEDGVVGARKELARGVTRKALTSEDWSGREVVVRVNSVDTKYHDDDVAAAVSLPISGIRIAKTRSVSDILHAVAIIDELEPTNRPKGWPPLQVWANIETVKALLAVNDIAACTPRLSAMNFGGGDLGADLGILRVENGEHRTLGPIRYEYLYAQSRIVAAARAYGIDPINMGSTSYKDLEGTEWNARYSAQLGFSGCTCLNPRQVPIVNRAFTPSEGDVSWAQQVVDDFEASTRDEERTVIVVGGEMVDAPGVRNARRILEIVAASETKDHRRAGAES